MSVSGVLARGRTAALMLMRDTCTVERKDGDPVLNDETGQLEQAWTTVYTGVCRVKSGGRAGQGAGRETEWGEREVTLHQYTAVLPWDTTEVIAREDRLTVTASDDTWLIGRHLEVIDISLAGTATARRLLVEDKEG
ncbi:hypothetical protein FH608_046090 [Nonomuraea phyllanthi]|uniref:Head-tail adaptor protein n=1 Tax=Nonomuraea phyllanthi TaxID=2219224 RepID=A0A5C4V6A1_9ACTN|nr:DUF6093 family protein [Nonomuraea phyllanthi]KAB8186867.1 hypothetical protein FH608_046090 [Nonomuraea phyllanthi]